LPDGPVTPPAPSVCSSWRAGLFRELTAPFHPAVTQVEQAEWLIAEGRAGEARPLVTEAREVFERLEAKPWLERLVEAGAEKTARAAPI
jgi:hypothetical protein